MSVPATRASREVSLLDLPVQLQAEYESRSLPVERKRRGQIFTPPSVARFMASAFSSIPKECALLDPGAGGGILVAAVCENYLRLRAPRFVEIQLYESDHELCSILEETMSNCARALREAGHSISYTIHCTDFLMANAYIFGRQGQLFKGLSDSSTVDRVIMNPPYFKINKTAEYTSILAEVVHGQPNIYAFFMAMGAEMLSEGGEIVAITPRSFCNGMYFRGFRKWFMQRMSLQRIHLFESRKEVFKESDILQESLVTHWSREPNHDRPIKLSTSRGSANLLTLNERSVRRELILESATGDNLIRVPETDRDEEIVKIVSAWPQTLTETGLRISTGPVVMFRTREHHLESDVGKESAPLLSMHNVKPYKTVWPAEKRGKPAWFEITQSSIRYLVPSRNYVLLRRFSAKEERRRLTASPILKHQEGWSFLALENHLNYIYHAERELSSAEIFGLTSIFNSRLLDRYFRTLSGSTQVNACEIRTLPFPDLDTVARIGKQFVNYGQVTMAQAEDGVWAELGFDDSLRRYLESASD